MSQTKPFTVKKTASSSNNMQSLSKSFSAFSLQSQIPSAMLSMEVSYVFHLHLIGRSGKNINRVMADTGMRIHFPDGNRIAGEFKRNGVFIRGPIENLENARQRIRASIPVKFIVDCNIERVNSIGESSLSDYFSKTFVVLLRFYPKIDGVSCQVNIRGQQDRLQFIKDAVTYFGRTALFLSKRVRSRWIFHDQSILPARILALQTLHPVLQTNPPYQHHWQPHDLTRIRRVICHSFLKQLVCPII